jgi:hypothetical protein
MLLRVLKRSRCPLLALSTYSERIVDFYVEFFNSKEVKALLKRISQFSRE